MFCTGDTHVVENALESHLICIGAAVRDGSLGAALAQAAVEGTVVSRVVHHAIIEATGLGRGLAQFDFRRCQSLGPVVLGFCFGDRVR